MGIDIFLEWDGMNEADKEAQQEHMLTLTGGHTGYLREAYHGEPYATHILVRESFEAESGRAKIPAAVMRERMTRVTEPVYGKTGGHRTAQAVGQIIRDMVEESGDPELHIATVVPQGSGQTLPMTVEEAIESRARKLYNASDEEVAEVTQSFWDFVQLAEEKEKELGKPCTVFAWH
jgi:hypothetical protein